MAASNEIKYSTVSVALVTVSSFLILSVILREVKKQELFSRDLNLLDAEKNTYGPRYLKSESLLGILSFISCHQIPTSKLVGKGQSTPGPPFLLRKGIWQPDFFLDLVPTLAGGSHPSSSLQGPHRLSRGANAAGGVNSLPPPQGCKHEKGPVLAGGAKDETGADAPGSRREGRGAGGQGRLQPRPLQRGTSALAPMARECWKRKNPSSSDYTEES